MYTRFTARIKRKLTENNYPNDVIIKYYEDFEENRVFTGNISYYADREGVTL
jgi:hypothetical protein